MRRKKSNARKLTIWAMALACAGALGLAPAASPAAAANASVPSPVLLAELKKKFAKPTASVFPAENQFTPEREELGKTLFFDPWLSGSKFISCATCHNPGFAWGGGSPKGIGDGMKSL